MCDMSMERSGLGHHVWMLEKSFTKLEDRVHERSGSSLATGIEYNLLI
jgi:hypothetical protein